ncbi:MAG TPA: alpha-hydroxy-acid oxidizing protein, partial [Mycobacteriales bacterium]
MPFGDFQFELYLRGLAGQVPDLPMTPAGVEAAALARMDPKAAGYVAGGAGAEQTMRANREAFERWRIVPRMLRGITERNLSTTVCGTPMPAPVMLAPIGVLGIVHPDAERAVARAAAATGVPMVLSTAASTSMEEVAAEAGDAPRWYQLYWPTDRTVAASLVHRAEAAGYRAIVVTVDTWTLGWRPRDLEQAYLPFLTTEGLANYLSDPAFRAGLAVPPEQDPQAAVLHWVSMFGDPALTWDDLAWLAGQTELPVLLKGICHPDDARAAADAGVAGI